VLKEKPSDASKTRGRSHCLVRHGALSIDSFAGMAHPHIAEAAPVSTDASALVLHHSARTPSVGSRRLSPAVVVA
jgi:hypothetical protein